MADIQEYSVSIKFETKGSEKAAKDTDKINKSIKGLKSGSNGLSSLKAGFSSISSIGGKTSQVLKGLTRVVSIAGLVKMGKGIVNLGQQTVKLSQNMSDYIETTNLFRESMGSSAEKATEFRDKAESLLGLDPSSLMNSLASFQNLSEGFGIASDRAYTMSENLTQLAGDLSSFANISFDTAQQKLMSGFSGQVMPLRKYGIALDQASLQELAYSLGIDQRVKSMTRAQKTELIYYQIMKSTSKMQGDLSRTLMSPANALRVLQTEFKQLARAVGSIFIPIIQKIIPIMRAVTKALTQAATAVAKFFGFEISDYTVDFADVGDSLEGISDGVDDIGDSAEGTAKKLNKMLMPFDELNNITSSDTSGSGSGIGGVGGGSLGIDLPTYDMFEGIDTRIQKFGDILGKVEETIHKVNDLLRGIDWDKIKDVAAEWGTNLGELINLGIRETDWELLGETLAEGMNTVFTFLQNFLETTDFVGIGMAITNLIEGFIDNVEWDKVAKTLEDAVVGLLDTLITIGTNFDMDKVFEAIWEFISNIDWEKLFDRLGKLLAVAFKNSPIMLLGKSIATIIEFVWNGIIDAINSISFEVPDWVPGIGGETFGGFDFDYVDILGEYEENVNKALGLTDYAEEEYEKDLNKAKKSTKDTFGEIEKTTIQTVEDTQKRFGDTNIVPFFNFGHNVTLGFNDGLESGKENIFKTISGIKDKMKTDLDSGNEAKEWGNTTTDNYEKGLNTHNTGIVEVFNNIKQMAKDNMDLANETNTWGINTVNSYNEGAKSEEEETNNIFTKIKGILDENMNQTANATEYGWQTVSGYDKGLDNGSTTLMGTFAKIKQVVGSSFNQTQTAYNLGSQTADNYNRGIENDVGTGNVYNFLNGKIKSLFNFKDQAFWWGKDLIDGFNRGLEASKNLLTNTTETIAKIIRHYLHFSRPDEGPLRDYETWMPDMMKGLSDSLVQAAPILDTAVNKISEMLAESLSNIELPNVEQSLFVNQNASSVIGNIGNKTNNAAKDNVTSNMIRATYEAVSKALTDTKGTSEGQPIVVNIGNKELYRGYGQYQDEQSNMLGVNVN